MADTAIAIRRPQDPALKLERVRRRTLHDTQMMQVLLDPQVIGLATLLGGIYVAQKIPWAEDEARNDMLRGVATTGVILMGLSRAGIAGWPAVAAAGIAGAATVESSKPLVEFKIPDWLKSLWPG
jgi:hypothetical protein